MCVTIDRQRRRRQPRPPEQRQQQDDGEAPVGVRVVLVDEWHERWPQVRTQMDRAGHLARVQMSETGFLSARENVLAAVVGDRVAAHLSFHVKPGPGTAAGDDDRPCVEAEVGSYGIDSAFRNRGIERVLRDTAIERARALRCGEMTGFNLAESWS